MSLHIDIFSTRKKTLRQSDLFRSDQDIIDVLNTDAHILEKFHMNHPIVVTLYSKLDNDICFGNNGCAEVLYLLYKENGITLLRYNFHESQKDKYQGDLQSTMARKYVKAYVSNGNDLMTAHDFKNVILYMVCL